MTNNEVIDLLVEVIESEAIGGLKMYGLCWALGALSNYQFCTFKEQDKVVDLMLFNPPEDRDKSMETYFWEPGTNWDRRIEYIKSLKV